MTDAQFSNLQLEVLTTGTPEARFSVVEMDVLTTGAPTLQMSTYSVDVVVSWEPPPLTNVYDQAGNPREVYRLTGSGLEPVFLTKHT